MQKAVYVMSYSYKEPLAYEAEIAGLMRLYSFTCSAASGSAAGSAPQNLAPGPTLKQL